MTQYLMRTLVWFRGKDLRISDHAPLAQAAREGEVVCVFVLDPYFFDAARAAELPHRMQFLLESLESLAANLQHLGSRLLIVPGKSVEVIPKLAAALAVSKVVAYRWVEPFARARDARVKAALGVPFELFEGELLMTPGTLRTGAGTPFSVFTPFARAHRASITVQPAAKAPRSLPKLPADVEAWAKTHVATVPTLESLGLARNPLLLAGGERAGQERLRRFLDTVAANYQTDRDRLDRPGTSRISVDLKFGTLSVTSAWNAALASLSDRHPDAWKSFSNELLWREFAHSVLWENPKLLQEPHRPEFRDFPWQGTNDAFAAWCDGRTGYPVVDAAARQLLGEGFVHNRARMIAASFLTKHLLIDYRRGEAHYMKYLTDGDWAQNNAGFQWATGCGFDAQPYFRVFNPILQGNRFDPEGAYVKRWVPELAEMPVKYIQSPWEAPPEVARKVGLGARGGYPLPIVDHAKARARFLEIAQKHVRGAAAASHA
jgi:deoxyribodipyrimidine photo-lyase